MEKVKFRSGAASFYIVAFSALILLIVATSFAAIIISEVTRTSNDDLAQSAYDSAMAGIEDARTAFYNYQNCKINKNASGDCESIIDLVNKQNEENANNCGMVGKILKRDVGDEGVLIRETRDGNNNMQQWYSCAILQTKTRDYVSTLNSTNQVRLIDLKFNDDTVADKITDVEINWYSADDKQNNNPTFSNYNSRNNRVTFSPLLGTGAVQVPTPPTLSVALVQAGDSFSLSDFDFSTVNQTNRGMIYLVPTESKVMTPPGENDPRTYETGIYKDSDLTTNINETAMVKSNDKTSTNLPYTVYCGNEILENKGYMCSARIKLPKPISGKRNPNNFMMAVALPYGAPNTEIQMKFYCLGSGTPCEKNTAAGGGGADTQATLDGVQIVIDSTGRANDLYRRVQVRMEMAVNSSFLSIMGPLELLGNDNGGGGSASGSGNDLLDKDLSPTCENDFAGNNLSSRCSN